MTCFADSNLNAQEVNCGDDDLCVTWERVEGFDKYVCWLEFHQLVVKGC